MLASLAVCAGALLSPLSPYRRPATMQPARLAADVSALAIQANIQLRGGRIAVEGLDTRVKPSGGQRGNGLFAQREFRPGEIVARYSGILTSYDDFFDAFKEGLTSGDYISVVDAKGARVLDAEPSIAGLVGFGRMVNHSKRKRNCYIWSVCRSGEPTGVAYVVTEKSVRAGSEFFLDYGDKYWQDKFRGKFDPIRRFSIDFL